jgi:Photosynthesis system II assembly factor YCF48
MRRATSLRAILILAVVSLFLAAYRGPHAQNQQSAGSPNKWQPVTLPFRPTAITATATTFWVCGADEMIARSSDGGRTWKTIHQNADGDVLLAIDFADERVGFAAGTNGRFLFTNDAGATWRTWTPDSQSTLALSFTDDHHGIRQTPADSQITSDGGEHWSAIPFPPEGSSFRPPFRVLGIAALSASNLAVEFAQSSGEHIYFSTTDGGKSWKAARLDNIYAASLYVHGGEYWSYGIEYVDRENHGGHGVGVALHSTDGEHWLHGAPSPKEFYGCAPAGCILDTGGFADLSGAAPKFASLPTDAQPSRQWALAGESICSVDATLQCASAAPSAAPSSIVLPNRPIAASYVIGAYSPDATPIANCLVCALTPFPLPKNKLGQTEVMVNRGTGPPQKMYMPGLNANVEVELVIRKDGSVDRVRVDGAPEKEIKNAISADVQSWLFVPPRENGAPAEQKTKIKLNVNCMAFGGNDEATCSSRVPPPPKP